MLKCTGNRHSLNVNLRWMRTKTMSHSIYSYLQRRSTEELENVLMSYLGEVTSELNREVIQLTLQVLSERNVYLSAECLNQIRDYFENS